MKIPSIRKRNLAISQLVFLLWTLKVKKYYHYMPSIQKILSVLMLWVFPAQTALVQTQFLGLCLNKVDFPTRIKVEIYFSCTNRFKNLCMRAMFKKYGE